MSSIPRRKEIEIRSSIEAFISQGVYKSGLSKKFGKWFKHAANEAFKGNHHSANIGCIFVYKNHILAKGHNQLKTDPLQKKYDAMYREWSAFKDFTTKNGHTLHAEMDALKSIPYPIGINVDWKKVKVFVYRIGVGLDNYSGLSLPCSSCANALSDVGIRKVYYTTGNRDKPFGCCDI